jgi:molybdopterin molybdotransferase
MAQLSNDCFAMGDAIRSIDQAVAAIASRLTAIDRVQSVPLASADWRILVKDLIAGFSLPPFANSAVDGYAIRGDDLPVDSERSFVIAGRTQAGMSPVETVAPGHCVRIFTGAPMPSGADTVFMQEDVRADGAGNVILPPGLRRGANARPAGEDIAQGDIALAAGRRLQPQDVALAAALGLTQLTVRAPVRVAVFSTGDEIVNPGVPRKEHQLFDSNRVMLVAMLRRLDCEVIDLGILGDEPTGIESALKNAARNSDLIIASGGVSTGDADFVRTSLESIGTLVFWRMAIKPGRPVAMGVVEGTPFIGLPGNPVASFVTFVSLVRPAVFALAGARQPQSVATPVRAAFSYRKKAGRREYVRVSLRRGEDGAVEATKFPREGAGLLSSLVKTDGLVELAEEVTSVEPGHMIDFRDYQSLL